MNTHFFFLIPFLLWVNTDSMSVESTLSIRSQLNRCRIHPANAVFISRSWNPIYQNKTYLAYKEPITWMLSAPTKCGMNPSYSSEVKPSPVGGARSTTNNPSNLFHTILKLYEKSILLCMIMYEYTFLLSDRI